MTPPNILVILTDQQRIDTVGAYGSPICRTPHLDRFAQTAAVFDQAYTVCALCSPARATIYTGLYPHHHGMERNEIEFRDDARLISQDFRDAGYQCGFVGKWHCGVEKLPRDFGFDGMSVPGYGNARKTPEYQAYLARAGLEPASVEPEGAGWSNNTVLMGKMGGPVEASVPYFLAEETIAMLRRYRDAGQPFLIFLNFWGPHAPYLPSEPYASMYDPAAIPPWPNFGDTFEGKPVAQRRYRDAFYGEGNPVRSWEEWAAWVARYFGFVTQIDAQIGRVVAALDALELAASTAVLFSTDHGEHAGAHGGVHDKEMLMYQETYHIPFMLRLPGQDAPHRVAGPISNLDIAPTLLDLAGIPPARPLDGLSLLPLLRGEPQPERDGEVLCMFNGHHVLYQSRMITDGAIKYVFNPTDHDELYDLRADPWELHNQVDNPAYAGRLRALRARMEARLAAAGDTQVHKYFRDLFAPRPPARPENFTPYRD